jgi:hypothetical protein
VPPNSVRVWRGFRLASVPERTFFDKLGSVFCPATVQIQAPVGLTAYLPSVLPSDKHPAAPDEIAIVFYEYQNAYEEAKQTVGGRAYSDLHALVFDLNESKSGFPELYAGTVATNAKYYLFEEPVDWQMGYSLAFVGVCAGGDEEGFRNAIAGFLSEVQQEGGPDGAIASASSRAPDSPDAQAEFVVYWEHWPDEAAAANSKIPQLADLEKVEAVYHQPFTPCPFDAGLWRATDGVKVDGGESFNFQFTRRPIVRP